MYPPILIAGPPRSGTTLIAWLLHLHGAWIGEAETTKDPTTNPLVGTENTAIKRWLTMLPADTEYPAFRERLLALVDTDGPWLVKTSNLLTHWRLFATHFPEARWVLPNRPLEDIVASDMRRRPVDYRTSRNIRATNKIVQMEIAASGVEHHWVIADRLAREDMEEARKLVEFCGLSFDPGVTREWIQPERWTRETV